MRKVFTTASLYRTTSSSSRHRGYVGDVAKAQPVHHLSSVTQCWCTVGTVGALRIAIVVSPLPTSHAVFPTSLCELQCGQFLARHLDALLERAVPHHLALALVHAVNYRGVIPAAERLADLDELHAQHVARQVHRHLAGDGERLGPRFGAESLRGDAPAARDHFLHTVDAGRRLAPPAVPRSLLALADFVRQRFARELDRDLAILERGEEQQLDDAPLQLAHARANVLGD